ncbi:Inositol polyphosphate 1-phosphatase like protein [Argiope bruennichi]|uniref:Inositol polyphosphate 1-phosphatase like protein n=1 Tax=Argiope bruennichi TaxID=94029 RepID=A0A8T0EFR1_ARGBR|nr:Inositol polyphosphate 1-phosphatase like protein [Argiope bruennichi]
MFPALISNIFGEEQNKFQNSLGESIVVDLTESEEDTATLLNKVLDGRDHIAKSIASVVHSSEKTCEKQYLSSRLIPANNIGIWIDPIDSTAEYIQAKNEEKESFGIQQYGLKCVCVLIGAYEVNSGKPILGVVNQPFFKKKTDGSKWESRFYWSIDYGPDRAISTTLENESPQQEKVAVLSSSECKELQDIIASKYNIVHTAGAGYKSLVVACGMADLYILSQGTTYFWDTCGPHALLSAQGGGIVRFDEVVHVISQEDLLEKQVKYSSESGSAGNESFRNAGGFIAYRNPGDVIELLDLLRQKGYLFNK